MSVKYSVLDLATVTQGHTIADSFKSSVANVQQAERLVIRVTGLRNIIT